MSRTHPTLCTPALAVLLIGTLTTTTGCRTTRSEDALEPNDTTQTATVLTAGQAVEGRANQGNLDLFAVEAAADQTILFRLESLGLEDCAKFTVSDPAGQTLYRDSGSTCDRGPEPDVQAEGVTFTRVEGFGYELRIPAATAGTYLLTIDERGQADNIFAFSWDYRVTATVE